MEKIEKEAYILGAIFTFANRLQFLGDKLYENISMKQWLLIAVISKCKSYPPSISEIAEIIGSSRQNVKKMALILQERGFVSLDKDSNDARVIRITLTPKCLTYFQEKEEKELQFMSSLFDNFDETHTNGLYEGLAKLAENITEMENCNE